MRIKNLIGDRFCILSLSPFKGFTASFPSLQFRSCLMITFLGKLPFLAIYVDLSHYELLLFFFAKSSLLHLACVNFW
jgi:hypothetical protein